MYTWRFSLQIVRERERKRLVSKFCACRIFSLYETFCSGVVVEDCLFLLTTLLKNNSSNQNFFRESSYIQRLTPYFDLDSQHTHSQAGWSAQKVSNLHLMLQVGTEMSHEVSEFCFFLIQAFFFKLIHNFIKVIAFELMYMDLPVQN